MEDKKKILVVGKNISEEMRAKIAELMEAENADAVYVDDISEAREKYPDLLKTHNCVIVNENKKTILATGEHLFKRKAAHAGVNVVPQVPKSFTDIYGAPPTPEPFVIKNRELPDEQIKLREFDKYDFEKPPKKRYGNYTYAAKSEASRRKKRRSQKKARKQNRRK